MPNLIPDLSEILKKKVDLRYAVLLICGNCGYSFYAYGYGEGETICPRCQTQVFAPADADGLSLM